MVCHGATGGLTAGRPPERIRHSFHKRTGRIIKLLTVQEILDEEFVQKM